MLIKFTFVKHRVNKNRCHFKIQKLYYTCNWDFLPLSPALAALLLFCWLLTIFLLGLAFGLSEGGKFAKLVTFRAREDLKISEFYKICQCLRFIGIPKSLIICQHYKVRNSKVNKGNLVEINGKKRYFDLSGLFSCGRGNGILISMLTFLKGKGNLWKITFYLCS